MTSDNHENLIAREKPGNDGAIPSGNAIAVMNLFRLYGFTSKETYRKRADKTLVAFSKTMESSPTAMSEMMLALDYSMDSSKEVIIVSPNGRKEDSEPYLKKLRSIYFPNRVLIQVEEGEQAQKLATLIPGVAGKTAIGGKPVAYVCEHGVCRLPSYTPSEFAAQIKERKMIE